jgi:hypothetical protein
LTGAAAGGAWRRETFACRARKRARAKAREWFGRFPKAAYMTSWRELAGDRIEFVIRRLPSAN